jgi:hypothetical protein
MMLIVPDSAEGGGNHISVGARILQLFLDVVVKDPYKCPLRAGAGWIVAGVLAGGVDVPPLKARIVPTERAIIVAKKFLAKARAVWETLDLSTDSSTDEVHDLQPISGANGHICPPIARSDTAVVLNGDAIAFQI